MVSAKKRVGCHDASMRCLLFLSQLAAKGSFISLTVRGGGSDLSGAAPARTFGRLGFLE